MEPRVQPSVLPQPPSAAVPEAAQPAAACACAPTPARPLDLAGMSAPGDLRRVQVEEFTIDGICGVY
jgi:hypothetical protein